MARQTVFTYPFPIFQRQLIYRVSHRTAPNIANRQLRRAQCAGLTSWRFGGVRYTAPVNRAVIIALERRHPVAAHQPILSKAATLAANALNNEFDYLIACLRPSAKLAQDRDACLSHFNKAEPNSPKRNCRQNYARANKVLGL